MTPSSDSLRVTVLGCGAIRQSDLVVEWMSDRERNGLMEATGPITVFSGSVQEAIRLFPRSLNVAVALALALAKSAAPKDARSVSF